MERQSALTEEHLIAEIDLRTDRTRRTIAASLGNGVVFLAFVVLPWLAGPSAVFGDFDTDEGVMLALPALLCVVLGLALYRLLGAKHWLYRTVDALELCASAAFPAFFPLLDAGTTAMAGVFLIVAGAFWGQAKPGRAKLFGSLLLGLGLITVVVRLVRGDGEGAMFSAVFVVASMVAYASSVRARLMAVRAELRRNLLREEARALRVARERQRIETELTAHVGAQIDVLAADLTHAGLAEAATARRVGELVSELVFPAAQPVALTELSELTFSRCRALCSGVRITHRTTQTTLTSVNADSSRAVLRIAQELVRNAVVHGRARTIELALSASGGELSLTVSDDGDGLTQAVANDASGGLLNARTWAAESGGSLRLQKAAGFNTSLIVTLLTDARGRTPSSAVPASGGMS